MRKGEEARRGGECPSSRLTNVTVSDGQNGCKHDPPSDHDTTQVLQGLEPDDPRIAAIAAAIATPSLVAFVREVGAEQRALLVRLRDARDDVEALARDLVKSLGEHNED